MKDKEIKKLTNRIFAVIMIAWFGIIIIMLGVFFYEAEVMALDECIAKFWECGALG